MPPIKPSEVADKKAEAIPEPVFEAFNELIAQKWNGHSATFKLDDVSVLAAHKLKAADHDLGTNPHGYISAKGWLDVEESYRKAGWNVEYDQPAYCESYPATFTFSKKKG